MDSMLHYLIQLEMKLKDLNKMHKIKYRILYKKLIKDLKKKYKSYFIDTYGYSAEMLMQLGEVIHYTRAMKYIKDEYFYPINVSYNYYNTISSTTFFLPAKDNKTQYSLRFNEYSDFSPSLEIKTTISDGDRKEISPIHICRTFKKTHNDFNMDTERFEVVAEELTKLYTKNTCADIVIDSAYEMIYHLSSIVISYLFSALEEIYKL